MKRGWIWVLCGVMALMLTSCGEKERYVYTEEDKIYSSYLDQISQTASLFMSPGMESNVFMADVVAEVEIRSAQRVETVELDGGVPITSSYYDAQILDTWYGEAVQDDIQVGFMGTEPILHENDRIIMYLSYAGSENYYSPVYGEYSIYIQNPPDDTIYAFRLVPADEVLAGADISSLREITEGYIADVYEHGVDALVPVGDVITPAYDAYLASENPETE